MATYIKGARIAKELGKADECGDGDAFLFQNTSQLIAKSRTMRVHETVQSQA